MKQIYTLSVRRAPRRRRNAQGTPAAQTAKANLAYASQSMRLLSDSQIAQWRDYAATLVRADVQTGTARPRQWDKVYVGLACRFVQVNRSGTPPQTPPRFPFAGDFLTVTATPAPGGVVFTASGPTSPHVRVELLLQRLPSPVRSPQPGRFRSQSFVQFGSAGESVTVAIGRGWYVPAYRFVHSETGQDTPLLALAKVTVPG